MGRQKLPDICDYCSEEIADGTLQYVLQIVQGKSIFPKKEKISAKTDLIQCHKCFIKVCEAGYKPEWKKEIRNPLYKKGSSIKEEQGFWQTPEVNPFGQEQIA